MTMPIKSKDIALSLPNRAGGAESVIQLASKNGYGLELTGFRRNSAPGQTLLIDK